MLYEVITLRLKSVNRFMMGSIPAFLVLALPALDYAAGRYLPPWFGPIAALSPGGASLAFARAAYTAAPAGELALVV